MVILTVIACGCGSLAAAPIDVDYRLMELAAGGPSRADGAFLATLLSHLAFTLDPLDLCEDMSRLTPLRWRNLRHNSDGVTAQCRSVLCT